MFDEMIWRILHNIRRNKIRLGCVKTPRNPQLNMLAS